MWFLINNIIFLKFQFSLVICSLCVERVGTKNGDLYNLRHVICSFM